MVTSTPVPALRGLRIVSLALNLPGPAALQRCRLMGARCRKIEPPSGDPMASYSPQAYTALTEGVRVLRADLKQDAGLRLLHRELAHADVLLTSFRPSALNKLGLGWRALHRAHPALWQVAIVGHAGAAAESPGHDLTYLASQGLITEVALPPTLYADMGGALMATEAIMQAALVNRAKVRVSGRYLEVALESAAAYLAQPRQWRLTTPEAPIGGAHAGYQVYPCADGRVALAALESHFAQRLCALAGLTFVGPATMLQASTHRAIARFMRRHTRTELETLAQQHDVPLVTLQNL